MKAVPMARQNCPGSMRQVPVGRWIKGDKVSCTHCSLKLRSVRAVFIGDRDPDTGDERKYMVLPTHIGVGDRQPEKIDWGLV